MIVEMAQYKSIVPIVIFLLVISALAGVVSSQSSHQDFDEAEEDIEALYLSLDRTISVLEISLNRTLDVNLTVQTHEDEVSYNYSSESLGGALNHSMDALDMVGYSEGVLKDIEGEVSSYEYLESLYRPYSRASQNMTSFSETHIGFIDDMEEAVHIYEDWHENDRDLGYLRGGLEALTRASYDLKLMSDSLDDAESYVGMIDDERLDNDVLLGYISDVRDMLEEYEGFHEDILFLYRSIPSHVDLVVPSSGHPGEVITIYGVYVENGSYLEGVDVSLSVENVSVNSTITDEDGYYRFDYKIPWDTALGTLNVSVSANGLYRSEEIQIVKYPSRIELSADREEYYKEDIELEGRVITEAPVPLEEISLNATSDRTVDVSSEGHFSLIYNSTQFPWGRSVIDVSYQGNDTIHGSSGSVSFEVNIPTVLNLESDDDGDLSEEIHIDGRLINQSSEDGLDGSDVRLHIDGEYLFSIETDEEGEYAGVLKVDEVAPDDGLYKLESVFPGTHKYRSSESEPIFIYRSGDVVGIGEDPDEARDVDDNDDRHSLIPPIIPGDEIGLMMVFAVLLFILFYYFVFYRSEPIEERIEDSSSPPVLQKRGSEYISATSRDDVSQIYRDFIETLSRKKNIELKRGTTHRDIEREILHMTDSDEISTVTSVFEKAFFSSKELTKNEIERFNEGIRSLNRVIG
ncbi:MAG: carboxypeptidase-like regulatory domain-containing protein [Candidatus Saliniplasma sp.]